MHITYTFTDSHTFQPIFLNNRHKIFKDDFDFDIDQVLSEEEKTKRRVNFAPLKDIEKYYLLAKAGEELVGWSFGIQKSAEDFYMVNSAVFPAYRKQGIYTTMMEQAIDYVTNLGFQHIYSRHTMSNNAILIPKLKYGFIITGFEVSDTFGTLVRLSYYPNAKRRELMEIRMGARKMDEETMKLVK